MKKSRRNLRFCGKVILYNILDISPDCVLIAGASYGFDLHFHSLGNENKGMAAVETGGQQHAPGMAGDLSRIFFTFFSNMV